MAAPLDNHPDAKARVTARRENIERLLDLSAFLPAADRALLEQVFHRGATPIEVARLGKNSGRFVRTRLEGILRRVRHPLFEFAANHMELIPFRSRPTIRLVVFHGLGLRSAARRRGLGLHVVRRQIRAFRDLAQL